MCTFVLPSDRGSANTDVCFSLVPTIVLQEGESQSVRYALLLSLFFGVGLRLV